MKNFIFKSNESDFKKMFQSIETIQKNVLYITYRTDMLIKKLDSFLVDNSLQKQVDEFFEEDEKDIPEEKQRGNAGQL